MTSKVQHVFDHCKPLSLCFSPARSIQQQPIMSANSASNDIKANLDERREEFKERVEAKLEQNAAEDRNP